ncbi:MAG: S8 family serine peptidase [Planctomycetota bacterium]|jgi:subtilisin family serine protease
MKTRTTVLLSSLLLAAFVCAPQLSSQIQVAENAAEAQLVGEAPFHSGQLIVRFAAPVDLSGARAMLDATRYDVVEPLMPSIGMYLVTLRDGASVPHAILDLAAHSGLRYAVPDHVVTLRGTTPNDPAFGTQWHHPIMRSMDAWDYGIGDFDFVVSVVDGGCKLNHADLAANIYVNPDELGGVPGVDDDGNGYVDDINGWDAYSNDGTIPNDSHGTHVNGISGACGNNDTGVSGVNWNVTLMPVAGASGSTSTVVKAYNYVLAQKQMWLTTGGVKGANVVSTNSSFGVDFANCQSPPYKPWNDAFDAMGAVGILSCGATMNIPADVDVTGDTPTGCISPYMVAVTNTTSADVKNNGAAWGLTQIDLGAPGTSIYSTSYTGAYTYMTGTSMASPQVAGAIALMHSQGSAEFAALRVADPAAAALVVKQTIIDSVDTLPSLLGKTVSGGRLNLLNGAMAMNAWTGEPAWADLGNGLAGTLGTPELVGSGVLLTGTPYAVTLVDALPSAFTNLVVGGTAINAPFKGGTMVPYPTTVIGGLLTDSGGTYNLSGTWPNGIPSGLTFYLQHWIADPSGPSGFTASNGLAGTTP